MGEGELGTEPGRDGQSNARFGTLEEKIDVAIT